MPRYRQEVLNVVLAQLLQERGVASAPESIASVAQVEDVRIPDVLVRFRGLRVAIEGEVSDAPDAAHEALASAWRRVSDGIAHIGLAVVYPQQLRSTGFRELREELSDAVLQITVACEAGDIGPIDGTVEDLERALRHAFDQLVEEDAVRKAVELLRAEIDGMAVALEGKDATRDRLRKTLGIGEVHTEDLE